MVLSRQPLSVIARVTSGIPDQSRRAFIRHRQQERDGNTNKQFVIYKRSRVPVARHLVYWFVLCARDLKIVAVLLFVCPLSL